MFTAYWAVKGGAGATVLAAAHALVSAASQPTLLVDLDGDLPEALGVAVQDDADHNGVAGWLAAGDAVPADALDRLLVPVDDQLLLLPRGRGPLVPDRATVLARVLAESPRAVVVDAGTGPRGAAAVVARHADRSVLVTRACYLAVRRLRSLPVPASEIVLLREPTRALRRADVAACTDVPVRTTITVDPGVARAVDAGLLRARLPRHLRRALATTVAP